MRMLIITKTEKTPCKGKDGLLPCPFCGFKEPTLTKEYRRDSQGVLKWIGGYIASCPSCRVHMTNTFKETIMQSWNIRAGGK